MIKVTDDTFATTVLQSKRPVLVDFTAAWCPPCRAQKPLLERFAAQHPDVDVVYLDVDESPAVASAQGVQALPTLMLFVGGERKAMARGLQSASRLDALADQARPSA